MTDCKIHYKTKQLKISLFNTILWLLLGIIGLAIDKKNYFLTYGYTAIGLLHLISYLLQQLRQFLRDVLCFYLW